MTDDTADDVTDRTLLERRYRRLLKWYPRAYRRESEQEILGVLMAGAREGRRRPSPAESADLVKSALSMRLGFGAARPPRTVRGAVRLMFLGAAAELAAWITYLVTAGSVRSAMLQRDPAQWNATSVHLVAVEVLGPLAALLWLWLARANGTGHHYWVRSVFAVFFGTLTLSLLVQLAQGGAAYAPADVISTGVVWLLQFAAVVLLFSRNSAPYYRRETARGPRPEPSPRSASSTRAVRVESGSFAIGGGEAGHWSLGLRVISFRLRCRAARRHARLE